MANSDAPFGARPVRYKNGAKWNGKATLYAISIGGTTSGQAAVGDPVVSTGAADAEGLLIVQTRDFSVGEPNQAIRGFITSIVPGTPGHKLASLAAPTIKTPEYLTTPGKAYVHVADDPNLIFQIQVNSVNLAVAGVGLNCGLARSAIDTTTAKSGCQLNPAAAFLAASATYTMKIVGFPHDPAGINVVGSAYATVEVEINKHELGHGTGSAGV